MTFYEIIKIERPIKELPLNPQRFDESIGESYWIKKDGEVKTPIIVNRLITNG